ncbi:MAG: nucleotidyltransferase domain-containing protein [Chloroflexota bacterium]|nr:nucleotidyltransferase domain-containing protein [Chloroflexota bacterium]
MVRDQPTRAAEGDLMEFEKNITAIIQIITELVQPEQIILFGSRARDAAAHRYSDYDIALAGVDMDHRTERCLKEALDDRLGIFTVDLIDVDKADPEFKEIVVQNGIIVYES